jgi:hypothetical protein
MDRVPCVGCGGLVPDVEGPSHRYMLASPGCWAAYTETLSEPPGSMGPVTAIDAVEAARNESSEVVRAWVDGAWAAWALHHPDVRAEAARLVGRLG